MVSEHNLHHGRPPERRAATLRNLLKAAGVPKIDASNRKALEAAVAGDPSVRLEHDPFLACLYDARDGRERAHFVRVDPKTWSAMIEGVEMVRGTLVEVVARALEPRRLITKAEREKVFAWYDALYRNENAELHADAAQISLEHGELLFSFAPVKGGWLLVADADELRGSLDELLAAAAARWDARLMAEAKKQEAALAARRREHPPKEEEESNESGAVDDEHEVALPAWGPAARVRAIVRLERDRTEPSPAQRAALAYLEAHQSEVVAVLQQALFEKYEEDEAIVEELELPTIRKKERIGELVRLESAIVHAASHRGVAYVGFAFESDWEEEHGLGVLLHENRVVETGYMDTASLWWVPARDARKRAAKAAGRAKKRS